MQGELSLCFLLLMNVSSLCESQDVKVGQHRLAWQRQIDKVKENERRLELTASQEVSAEPGNAEVRRKHIEEPGETSGIIPADHVKRSEDRRDYLKEAEEFLRNYNLGHSVRHLRFSTLKSPTKKQTNIKKIKTMPSPSVKNQKDVANILAQNINTKEGLKAIVTELLKRRIDKLKSHTRK